MRILGIIPARYNAKRFPGKLLANIHGKSMIRRVWEQASKSKLLNKLLIATDDKQIARHSEEFGAAVIRTSSSPENGTERCAEVLRLIEGSFDFVVNIQGDEPFIKPGQIDLIVKHLHGNVELATLAKHETNREAYLNPNTVKVVLDHLGQALYFSRSGIPAFKNISHFDGFLKHIGIYAYRIDVLEKISQLLPTTLELAESLEQLRWLENGLKIKVIETTEDSHSIDTPGDLESILSTGII